LTQLLIPLLSNADRSLIVNTTSGLGAFPKQNGLVYSASKAGMRNFTTGLRYSLKETSIRVLELLPPVTDTGMTKGRKEDKMSPVQLVERILPQLRRESKIMTVRKMRVFLRIAILFPSLAYKISSKSSAD
jgi:short-subunit dehydrogenase involved in D-alanine esterification of teichoic acids